MTEAVEEIAQALTARQQMMEVWGNRVWGKEQGHGDGRRQRSSGGRTGGGVSRSGARTRARAKGNHAIPGPDGTGLDAQTQELVKCMTKFVIKHEQELMRLRPDLGFVIFVDTSDLDCRNALK